MKGSMIERLNDFNMSSNHILSEAKMKPQNLEEALIEGVLQWVFFAVEQYVKSIGYKLERKAFDVNNEAHANGPGNRKIIALMGDEIDYNDISLMVEVYGDDLDDDGEPLMIDNPYLEIKPATTLADVLRFLKGIELK